MDKLSQLIRGQELIVAPLVLNPIMARLAEDAGFKAIYLGGGSLGWLKCVTEANLTLTEMVAAAVDIRTACKLPIVLDAGGGWGDPVHMHRTIAMTRGGRHPGIELEDQLLPRRVEHHVGIDHLIPLELMLHKIAEARAARTDPDLVIIARTNARRAYDLDEALRRAEAFHKAGADMLFVHTRSADELRIVGERLPPPLMMFAPPDGFNGFPLFAARPGRARLSARRLLGHRLRGHVQGRAAVLRMPGARRDRSVPRPRRRRQGNEGGTRDQRARPSVASRTTNHEGPVEL